MFMNYSFIIDILIKKNLKLKNNFKKIYLIILINMN